VYDYRQKQNVNNHQFPMIRVLVHTLIEIVYLCLRLNKLKLIKKKTLVLLSKTCNLSLTSQNTLSWVQKATQRQLQQILSSWVELVKIS